MTAVLVSGGAGYIGSHFVYELFDKGFTNVVVVDDLSTGKTELLHKDCIFYQEKIGNIEAMKSILNKHKIEVVVNFAGSILVEESVADPLKYYSNNLCQTIQFLQAMQESGVKMFVFSSTSAVYGNVEGEEKLNETMPTSPVSPYGWSKLMVEGVLQDLAVADKDFRFVALRYFNAAGADVKERVGQLNEGSHLINVATKVVRGELAGMKVFGNDYDTPDGTAVRDFIHVSDLATIHYKIMNYLLGGGKSDIFNCGYSKGTSVLEVINSMERVSGTKVNFEFAPRRSGDTVISIADTKKLLSVIDFTPSYDDIDVMTSSALAWSKKIHGK